MAEPVQGPLNEESKKIPPSTPSKEAPPMGKYTPMDPAGVWQRFLSSGGTQQVSVEEVQTFIEQLNKSLQIAIQQNDAHMKKALDKMKRAQEGDWD
jgi:hypothetical protein